MTTSYRQPTLDEAVSIIMGSLTREYRKACLKFWREKYGDEFADQVMAEVERKWKGRKK